jgi:C1A family cysteine protease
VRLGLLVAALATLTVLSGGPPGASAADAGSPSAAATAAEAPWQGATFPSRLDVRERDWVTPVRSQGQYGTCWIMAATGSLESSVLRLEGLPLDFSENNLANHMASRLRYEGYAPSEIAAAYYARWEGPVLERSDPYPHPSDSPDYLRAVRHVQEVLFLPERQPGTADNAAVKWAVSTYGGVDAAIDFDSKAEYKFWNGETNAYFNGVRSELDHHVVCVGWDDAYPAKNFATRPPGDGAFLIKNSWGTDWGLRDPGSEGYFWISYYDVSFGKAIAVFDGIEPVGARDAIYQYDALGRSAWTDAAGHVGDAGGAATAWYANRFVGAGSGELNAVSFYTPVTGTSYQVRVAGSLAGVAAAPAAATGTVAVPGYHTISLSRPAQVTAGRSFVVAVRVTTPGWASPVPVERSSEFIAPRARARQSYLSADGAAWTDLTTLPGHRSANVCLKAFVDDPSGAGDKARPRVAVSAGVFRAGTRATVHWRLIDPAFSSASAVVVLRVRDASGTVVAERRIPAVAVGERGTWTLVANWPRGRYSLRGRAFDVAGHRQAQDSRAALVLRGAAAAASVAPGGTSGLRR